MAEDARLVKRLRDSCVRETHCVYCAAADRIETLSRDLADAREEITRLRAAALGVPPERLGGGVTTVGGDAGSGPATSSEASRAVANDTAPVHIPGNADDSGSNPVSPIILSPMALAEALAWHHDNSWCCECGKVEDHDAALRALVTDLAECLVAVRELIDAEESETGITLSWRLVRAKAIELLARADEVKRG